MPKWDVVKAPDDKEYVPDFDRYNRLFVAGFAGSGKSYMIRRYAAKLRERGDKVYVISFTHTAAKNVDGVTAHSLFRINVDENTSSLVELNRLISERCTILIDEINMFPNTLLRRLYQLPHDIVRIIAFGDFRQLPPPIEEHPVSMSHPGFIELFDGNRINLTHQFRADPQWANFCIDVHDKNLRPDDIRSYIGEPRDSGLISICKLNETRIGLNREILKRLAPEHSKLYTLGDDDGTPQTPMFVGLKVIACENKPNYKNGQLFEVMGLNSRRVLLSSEEGVVEVRLTTLEDFRPAYAITSYRCEGMTISEPYTIHESSKMGKKELYTCITRTTDPKNVTLL